MPDRRSHRGPHPDDLRLFASEQVSALRAATNDLSWLLSRSYAHPSSLKLVGDRYQLESRQRISVSRCACSDTQLERRTKHRLDIQSLQNKEIWIDGYNVLTTIEAALSGGVLIRGRDGCIRDMASMHGSYHHHVDETEPAIELLGSILSEWRVAACRWLFDQSVSNSGRLRKTFLDVASKNSWPWTVDLVRDPDPILAQADVCIASADSEILDHAQEWIPLANEAVQSSIPNAWIIDLAGNDPDIQQSTKSQSGR